MYLFVAREVSFLSGITNPNKRGPTDCRPSKGCFESSCSLDSGKRRKGDARRTNIAKMVGAKEGGTSSPRFPHLFARWFLAAHRFHRLNAWHRLGHWQMRSHAISQSVYIYLSFVLYGVFALDVIAAILVSPYKIIFREIILNVRDTNMAAMAFVI